MYKAAKRASERPILLVYSLIRQRYIVHIHDHNHKAWTAPNVSDGVTLHFIIVYYITQFDTSQVENIFAFGRHIVGPSFLNEFNAKARATFEGTEVIKFTVNSRLLFIAET